MIIHEKLHIGDIPTIVYGEQSDKVFLFVHGKCGNKEEAADFAKIVCSYGYQVISIDLPESGERKDKAKLVPWEVTIELGSVMTYIKERWQSISLRATSIGAWFSMLSFEDVDFKKCLLVSPMLDMVQLINNMMQWAGVSVQMLEKKQEIETEFGETLSCQYYNYANEHSHKPWKDCTYILYGTQDNMISQETVEAFANKYGCKLAIMENGEHWFHTEEQVSFMNEWTRNILNS